ncbi:MAG: hypothetical protein F6K30_15835 [Cyanothece sp. SIO2G6]|nr:hypothetical protein [Cyanothece sp. SIO2G6]
MVADPHYLDVILSFIYRGYRVQIAQDTFDGYPIFAAWIDHQWGSAIAVPCELTRTIAVRKAKRWVDQRLDQ